ncbi:hypothetical protein Droror1_Dr00008628 [Drosera rotundifolia]
MELHEGSLTDDVMQDIGRVKTQLEVLMEREEVYWVQRSRMSWLKESDWSTIFFHSGASYRQRRNRVRGLEDEMGNWTVRIPQLRQMFRSFYFGLFTSQNQEINLQKMLQQEIGGKSPTIVAWSCFVLR